MSSIWRYLLIALAAWFFSIPCHAENAADPVTGESESEKLLLERLMVAESGGRQFAKNPRSSALGPFQFVKGTFVEIMRRRMTTMAAGKSDVAICRLRVDPKISREAALIYLRETTQFFAARKVTASPANLRLAFFVGQTGAVRVLAAKPDTPLSSLLSARAIAANPGFGVLTAGQLIEKSGRDVAGTWAQAGSPELGPTASSGPAVQSSENATATAEAAAPPDGPPPDSEPTSREREASETSPAEPKLASISDSKPAEQFERVNQAAAGEPMSREREASETALAPPRFASISESRPAEKPEGVNHDVGTSAPLSERQTGLDVAVRCNLKLASCRKWLALAEKRSKIAQAAATEASGRR